MVSLILYSLALSSMYVNYPNTLNQNIRSECQPDVYVNQDNFPILYHYSAYDEDDVLLSYNRFELYFNGGQQLTFDIEVVNTIVSGQESWSLRFKTWQESYLSNVFLGNLHVHILGVDDEQEFYLPNVYFLGQNEYYEDDESGNYTFFWDAQDDYSVWLDFDICLLDYRFVDGSEYQNGYVEGWNAGNDNGFEDGYTNGYNDGYKDAVVNLDSQGSTALTIFTGIIDVGLLPINVFLAMMNFEVFGINIGGLISSLMTVAIAIIIFRVIFNGGSGGGGKS